MIGTIIIITGGLAFISSFFPWLRFHDVRRQKKQLEKGERNTTLIRASDRAFPAVGYLSGAFVASIFFSIYLAIVLGLMLLSVVLAWTLWIKQKNGDDEDGQGE